MAIWHPMSHLNVPNQAFLAELYCLNIHVGKYKCCIGLCIGRFPILKDVDRPLFSLKIQHRPVEQRPMCELQKDIVQTDRGTQQRDRFQV